MKQAIIATIIGIASSANAAGAYISGKQLIEYLESDNTAKHMTAIGYITGIRDMGEDIFWCNVPHPTTIKEMANIVKAYAIRYPETKRGPGDFLVVQAYTEAFPQCPKK